jgi:hypothetical protein
LDLIIERHWDGRPLPAANHVSIKLSWDSGDLILSVDAPYFDDPVPDHPVGSTWELWEHEVVEVFLLGDSERYTEIEVGPHGHFLLLRLDGYRNIVDRSLPMPFESQIDGERWRGAARIEAKYLPHPIRRLNAYSIHGEGQQRIYAAWTPVPGPKCDFHRLKCFPEVVLKPE